MIHIEPLGTGVLLPAFVVGYELPRGEPALPEGMPPWVVAVDQQAGGLAMSYPSVVGAVLRLEANADKAVKDIARLVRGFRFMAEDPDLGTLRREYPVLAGLVLTHGTEYTDRQLLDLGNVLSAHFRVPPLRSGIEAFVRHEPCDPLDYFQGWRVLRCGLRRDRPLRGSIYAFPGSIDYHVDDSNLADLDLADDVAYDEACQRGLMALGAAWARPGQPDVFAVGELGLDRERERKEGDVAGPDPTNAEDRLTACEGVSVAIAGGFHPPEALNGKGHLSIQTSGYTEVNLDEALPLLHGLEKTFDLEFIGPASDEDLRHLAGLRNILALKLNRSNVTDAGLRHLAGLKSLQILELSGLPVTAAGVRHLAGLANLCELHLGWSQADDGSVEALSGDWRQLLSPPATIAASP